MYSSQFPGQLFCDLNQYNPEYLHTADFKTCIYKQVNEKVARDTKVYGKKHVVQRRVSFWPIHFHSCTTANTCSYFVGA